MPSIRVMRPLLLLALCAFTLSTPAKLPATAPTTRPSDAFLDANAVHVVHLKLARDAWDKMQPTRGGLFSLFAATRPANEEATHDSPFGYHYAYVHASLDVGGKTYDDIGLRFKGNSSYMTGKDLKKPFKVDLNHFDKDLDIAGVSSFSLNNNAMDPTLMREALSYQFFRDAGVPASRTAWALVYVSVDKLHDHKIAGLYTVVEEIGKPFLRAHFGSTKGLLLKPENAFNLPYQGETFDKYEKMYRARSEGTPQAKQRLVEFVKLIHKADDVTFARDIERYLDVPAFLRFVAANALLANMDSFLSTGHNFYMYVHPDTLKVHFIPWDLNLSFGTFDWVGSIKEQSEMSFRQPYVKPNRLTERLLSISKYDEAYHAETARIVSECLAAAHMGQRIAAAQEAIAKAERQAGVPHRPLPPKAPPETDIQVWATMRLAAIQKQLASEDNYGYMPYWQQGFFGRGKPATRRSTTTRPAATQPAKTAGLVSPKK